MFGQNRISAANSASHKDPERELIGATQKGVEAS